MSVNTSAVTVGAGLTTQINKPFYGLEALKFHGFIFIENAITFGMGVGFQGTWIPKFLNRRMSVTNVDFAASLTYEGAAVTPNSVTLRTDKMCFHDSAHKHSLCGGFNFNVEVQAPQNSVISGYLTGATVGNVLSIVANAPVDLPHEIGDSGFESLSMDLNVPLNHFRFSGSVAIPVLGIPKSTAVVTLDAGTSHIGGLIEMTVTKPISIGKVLTLDDPKGSKGPHFKLLASMSPKLDFALSLAGRVKLLGSSSEVVVDVTRKAFTFEWAAEMFHLVQACAYVHASYGQLSSAGFQASGQLEPSLSHRLASAVLQNLLAWGKRAVDTLKKEIEKLAKEIEKYSKELFNLDICRKMGKLTHIPGIPKCSPKAITTSFLSGALTAVKAVCQEHCIFGKCKSICGSAGKDVISALKKAKTLTEKIGDDEKKKKQKEKAKAAAEKERNLLSSDHSRLQDRAHTAHRAKETGLSCKAPLKRPAACHSYFGIELMGFDLHLGRLAGQKSDSFETEVYVCVDKSVKSFSLKLDLDSVPKMAAAVYDSVKHHFSSFFNGSPSKFSMSHVSRTVEHVSRTLVTPVLAVAPVSNKGRTVPGVQPQSYKGAKLFRFDLIGGTYPAHTLYDPTKGHPVCSVHHVECGSPGREPSSWKYDCVGTDKKVLERCTPAGMTQSGLGETFAGGTYALGHFVPDADLKNNKAATYHIANRAPQYSKMNGGVWSSTAEGLSRGLGDGAVIYTGVVPGKSSVIIKDSKPPVSVQVPTLFWKVAESHGEYGCIVVSNNVAYGWTPSGRLAGWGCDSKCFEYAAASACVPTSQKTMQDNCKETGPLFDKLRRSASAAMTKPSKVSVSLKVTGKRLRLSQSETTEGAATVYNGELHTNSQARVKRIRLASTIPDKNKQAAAQAYVDALEKTALGKTDAPLPDTAATVPDTVDFDMEVLFQ